MTTQLGDRVDTTELMKEWNKYRALGTCWVPLSAARGATDRLQRYYEVKIAIPLADRCDEWMKGVNQIAASLVVEFIHEILDAVIDRQT